MARRRPSVLRAMAVMAILMMFTQTHHPNLPWSSVAIAYLLGVLIAYVVDLISLGVKARPSSPRPQPRGFDVVIRK